MTTLPVIEGGKTARVREQHVARGGGEPEEQVGHRRRRKPGCEGDLAQDEDGPAGERDAVEAEPAGDKPRGRRSGRRREAHEKRNTFPPETFQGPTTSKR